MKGIIFDVVAAHDLHAMLVQDFDNLMEKPSSTQLGSSQKSQQRGIHEQRTTVADHLADRDLSLAMPRSKQTNSKRTNSLMNSSGYPVPEVGLRIAADRVQRATRFTVVKHRGCWQRCGKLKSAKFSIFLNA
jgi:hypothetical protein